MKQDAKNSQYLQVKVFIMRNQIEIEKYRIETIKTWIYDMKEIQKKLEKIPKNDIRIFFNIIIDRICRNR